MRIAHALIFSASVLAAAPLTADVCTTQSQMTPQQRATLVQAGTELASLTAADNAEGVRARTMPAYAQDFGGIQDSIRAAAPHLQGASFVPESVWLLDATSRAGSDTSPQDAQFDCSLNRSANQATFQIPALPYGQYAMVVLNTTGTAEPWQLAMLLREATTGTWQLGGLFPRATTAGSHDGLWFWRAARDFASKKQAWNSYVYYVEAEHLLRPVNFVSSTNLETLLGERSKAAPAALSGGLGSQQPLVLAPAQGAEVRITSLGAENAPDRSGGLDLVAHVQADAPLADAIASRARNARAAKALVAAYPELRTAFHGVWIVADLPGGTTFISEEPMNSL